MYLGFHGHLCPLRPRLDRDDALPSMYRGTGWNRRYEAQLVRPVIDDVAVAGYFPSAINFERGQKTQCEKAVGDRSAKRGGAESMV